MNFFKKYLIVFAVISCSTNALASPPPADNKAHFGQPHTQTALQQRNDYPIPLEVINHTFGQFYVSLIQEDGTYDGDIPLDSVTHSPNNVISIDAPCWKVHVNIWTLDWDNIFDGYISANTNVVDINYSLSKANHNSNHASYQITPRHQ